MDEKPTILKCRRCTKDFEFSADAWLARRELIPADTRRAKSQPVDAAAIAFLPVVSVSLNGIIERDGC